jgi:hypothetical protein
MSRRLTLTLAAAGLGLAVAVVGAQSLSVQPIALAGCYTLDLGAWSRPFSDSVFHKIPRTVSLDTSSADRGAWRIRPNIPSPRGRRMPGTPKWSVNGDTVKLLWSDGFTPTIVTLARRADGTLHGHVVALSDEHYEGEPPPPEAEITARRTGCPVELEEANGATRVSVPGGLDSAATAAWLATQQRACGGQFVRIYDEVMNWDRKRDSVPVFRYAQILTEVRCVPDRPRR